MLDRLIKFDLYEAKLYSHELKKNKKIERFITVP